MAKTTDTEAVFIDIHTDIEGLRALVNRVDEESKAKDVKALRDHFREYPELLEAMGNIGSWVEHDILRRYCQDSASTNLAIQGKLDKLREEFGNDASPVWEQLIIQNILNCWLRLQLVELKLTRATHYDEVQHFEKRVNAAQRRYLRAIGTLARIRKLQLPPIQVNIGQQQVNQVNT